MPGNLNLCFTKVTSPPSSASLRRDHGRQSSLTKNFNSIYNISGDEDSDHGDEPDLATAFASQRFFFSSPGRSNSIVDSSSLSLSSLASSSSIFSGDNLPGNVDDGDRHNGNNVINGSIMVPTYSPDPYLDFRRSMQEMVDARDLAGAGASWDYLQELLACYLSLNPKSTHKYIVGAFADLLVSLVTAAQPPADGNRSEI